MASVGEVKIRIHMIREVVQEAHRIILTTKGELDGLLNTMSIASSQTGQLLTTMNRIHEQLGVSIVGLRMLTEGDNTDNPDRRAALGALGKALAECDEILNRVHRVRAAMERATAPAKEIDNTAIGIMQQGTTAADRRLEAWSSRL